MVIDIKHIDVKHDRNVVLHDVNFHANEGEFIYVVGKVGSGKSTLMKMLYADLPAIVHEGYSALAQGENKSCARILDFDLLEIKQKHYPDLRRELGIVFQDFQLLRDRTVESNLNFVLRATGWSDPVDRKRRIKEVMAQVELEGKLHKFPHELSGGEQQRVAIARALLNSPSIILADEPTGNLDMETTRMIVGLLHEISEMGTTVIMITHQQFVINEFPGIVYTCCDGRIKLATEEIE